jgi:hypothetical protein
MWKTIFVDNFILYVPQPIFIHMDIVLTYSLTQIEEGRIRIVVSLNEDIELGTLYFEKVKRGFTNKPLSMNSWACVDAKIEGLYQREESITPKEIVGRCQELIREGGY